MDHGILTMLSVLDHGILTMLSVFWYGISLYFDNISMVKFIASNIFDFIWMLIILIIGKNLFFLFMAIFFYLAKTELYFNYILIIEISSAPWGTYKYSKLPCLYFDAVLVCILIILVW